MHTTLSGKVCERSLLRTWQLCKASAQLCLRARSPGSMCCVCVCDVCGVCVKVRVSSVAVQVTSFSTLHLQVGWKLPL